MAHIISLPVIILTMIMSVGQALAGDISSGTIIIENPWARATPKGAKVGAGYMNLLNIDDRADRLVTAQSDVSERIEIHTMTIEGGVMKMRKLDDGLTIAPKSEVALKPGGYHLMFIGLKAPLNEGKDFNVVLKFEKTGSVDVLFKTSSIGGQSPYPNTVPYSGSAGGSAGGIRPAQGSSKGSVGN